MAKLLLEKLRKESKAAAVTYEIGRRAGFAATIIRELREENQRLRRGVWVWRAVAVGLVLAFFTLAVWLWRK
jgi:hypothetical protein